MQQTVQDKTQENSIDPESEAFLAQMAEPERIRANKVPGVRTVLVVLSSGGMVYDVESLRQRIFLSYPDSTVFFQTTQGSPLGAHSPQHVDLLIDFTGPGQRQKLLYAKKLRKMARMAVGRNAGLLRKRIYDRIFDEKTQMGSLPEEIFARERYVQKEVLNLAGVAFLPTGDTPQDRGKTVPLELPPLSRG